MNDIYAKQILKIFANNPFEAFNHKQVASRVGAHDKGSRQLVSSTILELAEANPWLDAISYYDNTSLQSSRHSESGFLWNIYF